MYAPRGVELTGTKCPCGLALIPKFPHPWRCQAAKRRTEDVMVSVLRSSSPLQVLRNGYPCIRCQDAFFRRWLWRRGPTRSHSEHGSQARPRPWYCGGNPVGESVAAGTKRTPRPRGSTKRSPGASAFSRRHPAWWDYGGIVRGIRDRTDPADRTNRTRTSGKPHLSAREALDTPPKCPIRSPASNFVRNPG